MSIEVHKITTAPENTMAQIRKLYEMSFPPAELREFERIAGDLVSPNGERRTSLLAAIEGESVLGISIYAVFPRESLAYLWYLCVDPETRGAGVGGRLYRASLDQLDSDGWTDLKGMIFEVERLSSEAHPIYGDPHRRVRFYQRLGARMIEGYDYHQPPIPPHDPVPLQLMFHPLGLRESECDSPALAVIVSDFLRLAQDVEDSLEGCELRLGMLE